MGIMKTSLMLFRAFFWNCYSIGNRDTQTVIRHFVSTHKPSLLCLAKPMVDWNSFSYSFLLSLKLHFVSLNVKPYALPMV